MKRRTLLTGAVPIAWAAGHAWAQSTADTRPVRLLVPFAAGGATDITARAIAGPLSQRLQRPITVENRPGAGAPPA